MISERLRRVAGDGPVYALLVLFGLNMVDTMNRDGFAVVLPQVRDEFGLGLQGILTLIAVVSLGALMLQVPIAAICDQSSRVRVAWLGALISGVFSIMTGLAPTLLLLAVARSGVGVGKAAVDPSHNSLLADYFDIGSRSRVFSFYRAGTAVGACIGPLAAGFLASAFGWRVPFVVFAVPTFVFMLLALRLNEPLRGAHERRFMGASEEAIATEEPAPSFAESWRIVWKIESLRRIWFSLPFLAAALIGFAALASLQYDQTFGLDERGRGIAAAVVEPAAIIGLFIGARIGTRLMLQGPAAVLGFLSRAAIVTAVLLVGFALAPNLGFALVMNAAINGGLAIIAPGVLAALALGIPPRARSMGFSVASLWVVPGLLILPVVGAIGDHLGLRIGMLLLVPAFLIGSFVIASARNTIDADVQDVWRAATAQAEVAYERSQGRSPLLLVRGLDVRYGTIQVLFDIDLAIEEGTCVALLGTNGAGKSTLLKAICGVVEADRGAVILDGREITHAPPNEIAALGVTQVPGGHGVFPSLTVEENLRTAAWLLRGRKAEAEAGIAHVYDTFPVLSSRRPDLAGDLSGGQQQMLALGMAFLAKPRLLLVDELSLGLAPVVVAQLLPMVEEIRASGTTVILVEQSVNVALSIADTALFMEKGEIRFRGPTAELLERPDVLRSVFLEGAARGFEAGDATVATGADAAAATTPAVTAADGPPALDVTGLTVSFGGIRAVNDVALAVAPGEIVGIIGPNGAGKTTLFDLISGFTRAERGAVRVGGVDVSGAGAAARARAGLGRSFQDARLFPSLTVTESIAVACERFVASRDPLSAALHLPNAYDAERAVTARVDELIELLGLGPYAGKFVRELSTGTRRVVDLACLLAHRPSVILLDEPSSGIAQRETEALGPMLRQIRDATGASLVVIEHDMPLVRAVADRLVAMDQGAVIAAGHPDAVLTDATVVDSYLGGSDIAINRSGALAGTD